MKYLLPILLIILLTGCGATGQFYTARVQTDLNGCEREVLVQDSELKCESWFGGCKAKDGDKEIEYSPSFKVPDIISRF